MKPLRAVIPGLGLLRPAFDTPPRMTPALLELFLLMYVALCALELIVGRISDFIPASRMN